MKEKATNQITSIVNSVDLKIAPFFTTKLPSLPENIRAFLAKITPYLTMLSVALTALALLGLLGIIGATTPVIATYGGSSALGSGFLGIIALAIRLAIEGMAIPSLLKNQRTGWNLLFASCLVGLLFDLVNMQIFNLIISFLISFYLLYQIKPYFKH